MDEIKRGIEEARNSVGERFTFKELMRTRKQIQIKMEKLISQKKKDQVIIFEELVWIGYLWTKRTSKETARLCRAVLSVKG